MHFTSRASAIHLIAAFLDICRSSRIQTSQLLNTMNHLGELANSHANETYHDIAKTRIKAEAVSNAVSTGKSGLPSNASKPKGTAIADTDRHYGLQDATGYLLSSAFLQSFFDSLQNPPSRSRSPCAKGSSCAGEFHLLFGVVSGGILKMLGYIFGGALIVMTCLGCCWANGGWSVSSVEGEGEARQQYLYKGRVVYEWVQRRNMIILYTKLPKGIKTFDVVVQIQPKHLKIAIHGKQAFINEELYSLVDDTQSTWHISWQGELAIHMMKAVEDEEWPCIIQAHHPSNIDESAD